MATTLSNVRTIGVPVSDQDAALAFFVTTLGFEPGMDAELQEGFRWIEVSPPGSPVSIALVAASDAYPSGVDTGIRFTTPDAAAEHAAMTAAGVDVDELLRWPGVPPMYDFRDPDGNTYYVSQGD
jgi:catechol 2,3-dioxygenase-like lactoylglutathione lyase family enzyme